MAFLSLFQELEVEFAVEERAVFTTISGDALTLLVASTSNKIYVYRRDSVNERFVLSPTVYEGHGEKENITSLATQDNGVYAVSGDTSGSIHIWRTDEAENSAKYKFHNGGVTSLSITTKYILAGFYDESSESGKVLLLNKGLNLKEKLTVEKVYQENYKNCCITEYGRDRLPYVTYYEKDRFVFEGPIHDELPARKEVLNHEVAPWCLRRNNGTSPKHIVFCYIAMREIIFWDPLQSSTPNTMVCRLKSTDSLRLNDTLVMSSVVSSRMFLVSLYEEKVNIITLSRKKSVPQTRDIEKKNPDSNVKPNETLSESSFENAGFSKADSDSKGNKTLKKLASYIASSAPDLGKKDKNPGLLQDSKLTNESQVSISVKKESQEKFQQSETESSDSAFTSGLVPQEQQFREKVGIETANSSSSPLNKTSVGKETLAAPINSVRSFHPKTSDPKDLNVGPCAESGDRNHEDKEKCDYGSLEKEAKSSSDEKVRSNGDSLDAIPDRFWELFETL